MSQDLFSGQANSQVDNIPTDALYGGARLMAQLSNQFGGDYAKALAAYNGGPGAVQAAVNAGGANWINFVPAESSNYVHIIMG